MAEAGLLSLFPQRKEALWSQWLLVMAINFNLLDHFNLIGHLGRHFKYTDETSPSLMKISMCKGGRPKPVPLLREGGGDEALHTILQEPARLPAGLTPACRHSTARAGSGPGELL